MTLRLAGIWMADAVVLASGAACAQTTDQHGGFDCTPDAGPMVGVVS